MSKSQFHEAFEIETKSYRRLTSSREPNAQANMSAIDVTEDLPNRLEFRST